MCLVSTESTHKIQNLSLRLLRKRCLFLNRHVWNLYKTPDQPTFKCSTFAFRVVPHLHARQGHHYSSSHLQHQARSIIFLENHYGCVFPWGRSYDGENRSSGMTVSSDLITSGAKPDSGKWFLVLSVSVSWIHDGTKITIMNSWHSKFLISVAEYCRLRVSVISVSVHRAICKCLGTYSTSHGAVCEEVIKCYLSSSSL